MELRRVNMVKKISLQMMVNLFPTDLTPTGSAVQRVGAATEKVSTM